jgi:lipopolysaccharide biosynthesis regulator YciM
MYDFCGNCDRDLNEISGLRVDAQFCSEKCKVDYHNTLRKVQRKYEAITRAVLDLQTIGNESDAWLLEVGNVLKKVKNIVEYGTGQTYKYRCFNCGHYHFGIPEVSLMCPECQRVNSHVLVSIIQHSKTMLTES